MNFLNGTMGRCDDVTFLARAIDILLIMCKIPCEFAAVSEIICNFANVNAHATACGQGQRHIRKRH